MSEITNWLNFASYTNDAAVGAIVWTSLGNAAIEDGSFAQCIGDGLGNYIKCLQPNNLPLELTKGTINGVEVRGKYNGVAWDGIARLVKNNVVVGNNEAHLVDHPTNTFEVWGGPLNTWGVSLIGADINRGDFGFVLARDSNVGAPGESFDLDVVEIRFYWTPGIW